MNIAKVVCICLVIAVVYCETTLEIPKPLQDINGATDNVTQNPMIDGQTRFLPSQNSTTVNTISFDLDIKENGTGARTYRTLTINKDMLRSKKKKNEKVKIESLLFEEYNDDGFSLISVKMRNLDDVAQFFDVYLHTKICHVYCDSDLSKK